MTDSLWVANLRHANDMLLLLALLALATVWFTIFICLLFYENKR